jgi:hypothetical protein
MAVLDVFSTSRRFLYNTLRECLSVHRGDTLAWLGLDCCQVHPIEIRLRVLGSHLYHLGDELYCTLFYDLTQIWYPWYTRSGPPKTSPFCS